MRPIVTVNCAMSPDGKIATIARKQVRISSPEDMERVKALRRASGAILVGVGTVLADDPHLTVKGLSWEENPLRVVLDCRGRTPSTAKVFDDRARTLIVTCGGCARTWEGAEVFRAGEGRIDLMALMRELERRGVQSLMVEGGGETIFSFFEAGLVDRYLVYIGTRVYGGKDAPTPADGFGFQEGTAYPLRLVGVERLGEGVLLSYERP
jgi:2,5-diamino-6-(ribosylamino)-4(3H)-pyrimidinone 5'-phosphate reductase